MLRNVFAAGVLAVTGLAAQAATYDIGTLPIAPDTFVQSVSVAAGSFTDTFNFIAPVGGFSGAGTAVAVDVGANILDVDGLTVSLYDAANNLVTSGPVGESSGVSWSLLSGANYSFQVSGNATGVGGGLYTFVATAALVPEPETFAMMLAGLGAIGFLARRRREPN